MPPEISDFLSSIVTLSTTFVAIDHKNKVTLNLILCLRGENTIV